MLELPVGSYKTQVQCMIILLLHTDQFYVEKEYHLLVSMN